MTKTKKVEPYGGYDLGKASMAVIAANANGEGFCMFGVGGHIRFELDEKMCLTTDELGLAPPGAGIWVWSGRFKAIPGRHNSPADIQTVPEGSWRRPTGDEFQRIADGECPWDDEDWKLAGKGGAL